MELEYTYWESKDGWLVGHLTIWPDHLTQGKTVAELEEMLLDLLCVLQRRTGRNTSGKENRNNKNRKLTAAPSECAA
jgi:hypothetical protein